jgi:hypothetical protein
MKYENIYSNTATLTNTNTNKKVEAEIADLKENISLNAFIAHEKIPMKWNGKTYVGNMFGMELTTTGPTLVRTVNTNTGRR